MAPPKADFLQGTLGLLILKARGARFYRLTKPGSNQLAVEEVGWDRFALAIAKVRKAV